MEEQQTQLNGEQSDVELSVDDRQSWEQPKLEQLRVSLDTAGSPGSQADGVQPGLPPP